MVAPREDPSDELMKPLGLPTEPIRSRRGDLGCSSLIGPEGGGKAMGRPVQRVGGGVALAVDTNDALPLLGYTS